MLLLQGFLSPGWRGGARGGGGGEGRTPEEDHLRQAEKTVFSDLNFFMCTIPGMVCQS